MAKREKAKVKPAGRKTKVRLGSVKRKNPITAPYSHKVSPFGQPSFRSGNHTRDWMTVLEGYKRG